MKRLVFLGIMCIFILSCCGNSSSENSKSSDIVGKWVDVQTEQIVEYTNDGYYYEYKNEGFTTQKTKFLAKGGKIYYYLEGDEPDLHNGINYKIKDGNLFIADVIEYKPLDLKTQADED